MEKESQHIVSDAGCVHAGDVRDKAMTSISVKMLLIIGFSRGYAISTRDSKKVYFQGEH